MEKDVLWELFASDKRRGHYTAKKRRASRPFVEWEADMTLCMAATCQDEGKSRIVTWADTRVEGAWAGANTGYKYDWVAVPGWRAMFSGRYSKAREFAATCRSILKPEEFTRDNIFDKLNEVSAAHKEKLCKRLVQHRLGISYDRFLKKGEQELTPEVRNRVLYEIEQLSFGCSLIIFGFIDAVPRIYVIDEDGEVVFRENFAAIGTGYVVAESILYYREQGASKYLERTLYNLYEAFAMTYQARAPGVGDVPQAAVHRPGEGGRMESSLLMSEGVNVLAACFEKFGPKPVKDVPKLDAECLLDDEEAYRRLDVLLQKRAFS